MAECLVETMDALGHCAFVDCECMRRRVKWCADSLDPQVWWAYSLRNIAASLIADFVTRSQGLGVPYRFLYQTRMHLIHGLIPAGTGHGRHWNGGRPLLRGTLQ